MQSAVDTLFPCLQGTLSHGAPKQMHRAHMELIITDPNTEIVLILNGQTHTNIKCVCVLCTYISMEGTGANWIKQTELCPWAATAESRRSSNLDLGKPINSVCNHSTNIYDSCYCLFSIYSTPVAPANGRVSPSTVNSHRQRHPLLFLQPMHYFKGRRLEIREILKTLVNIFDFQAHFFQ